MQWRKVLQAWWRDNMAEAGQASVGLDLLGANGMVVGAGWQTPMEPPGRPLPVLDVRRAMDAGGERDGASVVAGAGGVGHGAWLERDA